MTIEYVRAEDNSICILPSERDAKAILSKIKATPADKDDTDGSKKASRDEIAQGYYDKITTAREAAKQSKRLTVLDVSYEPYTRAHKIEARRLATEGEGEYSKLNSDLFEAHLVAMSTNMSFEKVVDLPESIYQLLSEKVFAGQSVSVDRLDFFDS